MDEDILQAGRYEPPLMSGGPERLNRHLQRGGVGTAHVKRCSKRDSLLHPRTVAKLDRQVEQIRAAHRPGGEFRTRDHFRDRSMSEQVPVGKISDPMASLRFIHVVSGDEEGEALGCQQMDLFPKITTGFGIDPRSGFIKEEQTRIVDEAGGQGEPLFPSSGEFTRQLLASTRKTEPFEALIHSLPTVGHLVHPGNEIEILRNAEVLVEAKALGHISRLGRERVAGAAEVKPGTGPLSGMGTKESAQHANKRCFPTPVWTEEAIDLATAHLKIDGIHHGSLSEPLGHSTHINGEVVRHG